MGLAFLVGDSFQGTYCRRADRDDTFALRSCSVDHPRSVQWHAIPFLVRRLVGFEAGDTGMQQQRHYGDAPRHQRGNQRGGEGASGGRHLGASHLGRIDRLVILAPPALRYIVVMDREPVLRQVRVQRAWADRDGSPTDASAGRGSL